MGMPRRAVLLALVLLGLLPASALASAQVELRPAAGPAGSAFVLHGAGFAARKTVTVAVTGRSARRVRADRSGAFQLTTTAPKGHRTLAIASRRGRVRVANRFSVTAASGAGSVLEVGSSGGQRVRVSPLTLLPGGTLRLQGAGFRARQALEVSGLGAQADVRVARNGRFSTSLLLPATLRNTGSTLSISGSGVKLRLRLARRTVEAPVVAPTPPAPPAGETLGVVVASPEPPVKPASTGAPAIGGTAKVGSTLTADAGAWTGTAPIEFGFQWQRCGTSCADIGGATASSYPVASADAGKTLKVVVTARNGAGSTAATSPATSSVTAAPVNTKAPSVSSTAPEVNDTLTAGPGTWTGTPTPTYGYQWWRCTSTTSCVAMAATKTYKVAAADVGFKLRVDVTATNSAGTTTVKSSLTAAVAPASAGGTLVAFWSMDDTDGVMRDSSGNGFNSSSMSGVTSAADGLRTAFRLTGGGSGVRVPGNGLVPGAQNVTITMSVKPDKHPPNSVEDWDLLKKGDYQQGEWKVEIYPNGRATCGFAGTISLQQTPVTTTDPRGPTVGPDLVDGQWHVITCKKTTSAVITQVDGVTVNTISKAVGDINTTAEVVLGAHASGGERYEGLMDDVSVRFG